MQIFPAEVMRFHPQSRHFENPRANALLSRLRFFAAIWLLVSMAAHTLDACASHFALPDAPETAPALNVKSDCVHENCVVCPQSPADHTDICETVSETATRGAQGLKLKAPFADAFSWAVVPLIAAPLSLPTDIIRSRDGPEDFSLPPSPTGSTCSGRAPPFSA